MLPEKWDNLVNDIKDKFEVEEHEKKHLDEQGGTDIEAIIFKGPMGRVKLEFIIRPLVLDRKTSYSKKRLGGETGVEYIYSPDEKIHKMKAYKWDEIDNDWIEMDAKNFN